MFWATFDKEKSVPMSNEDEFTLTAKQGASPRRSTRKPNKKQTKAKLAEATKVSPRRLTRKLKPNHHNETSSTLKLKIGEVKHKSGAVCPRDASLPLVNNDATLAVPTISQLETAAGDDANQSKNYEIYRYELDLAEMAELNTINVSHFVSQY